jgi:hypothetical protein
MEVNVKIQLVAALISISHLSHDLFVADQHISADIC